MPIRKMSRIYSVSEISAYVKHLFTEEPFLRDLSLRGEVSGWKYHTSGHIYFTLKDAESAISCVMFKGDRLRGLKTDVKDGMTVIVSGRADYYAANGRVQIYAREIRSDGEGELYKKFEELKKRLSEEGLFSQSHKKPIPKYALRVGVVTAQTGAALQDIIRTTQLRNPYVQLILSPARVQGTGAAESIVSAIRLLDRIRPDVMIVGRGGGSQEDLWCFNEEIVARAIYECETPVISAVGHEVDFTIADFCADLRAATPTAAAEAAVFLASDYLEELAAVEDHLAGLLKNRVASVRLKLERDTMRLRAAHPKVRLERYASRLRDLRQRSRTATERKAETVRNRMKVLAAKMNALSPLQKLTGGFGYVEQDGRPVPGFSDVRPGDKVTIRMRDERADAEILTVEKEERYGRREKNDDRRTSSGN